MSWNTNVWSLNTTSTATTTFQPVYWQTITTSGGVPAVKELDPVAWLRARISEITSLVNPKAEV